MGTESELLNKAISHKGEKRKSYSMEFKKDVVKYATQQVIACPKLTIETIEQGVKYVQI